MYVKLIYFMINFLFKEYFVLMERPKSNFILKKKVSFNKISDFLGDRKVKIH